MIQFFVRRLIASIPVLLGVIVIVFVLVRVIPGDPCTATLGEKANAERCAQFNERIGLHEPIPVQLDGDAAGHTPLVIDLLPSRVPFIVPA